ncbi:MAG: histidine phosphatase family protein, partial [Thermoleophilia bacterium]
MSHGAHQVLVLMRHGVAEDIDSRATDDERELTAAGRADADLAAQGLVALGIRPDVVVSSPLIRCHQTAEMVARAAGCALHDDARLAPGMTTDDLLDLVIDFPDA